MALGTSIVLIAIGAILSYAVTFDVPGIDINTVGFILMIIGIIGLGISLIYMFMSGRSSEDLAQRRPGDRY
jgi:Domain of unknown function (DUF6458)